MTRIAARDSAPSTSTPPTPTPAGASPSPEAPGRAAASARPELPFWQRVTSAALDGHRAAVPF